MKVVTISIVALALAACAATNAAGPNGLPADPSDLQDLISENAGKNDSFQVMRGLTAQLGARYVGLQSDGTVIECVAGIRDTSLARTAAGNRARATLAFASANATVQKTVQDLPGGGKLVQVFKSATASGIAIAETRCAKMANEQQVCCARAQATELPPEISQMAIK